MTSGKQSYAKRSSEQAGALINIPGWNSAHPPFGSGPALPGKAIPGDASKERYPPKHKEEGRRLPGHAVMKKFFGLFKSVPLYQQEFGFMEHARRELIEYLIYCNKTHQGESKPPESRRLDEALEGQ